MLLRINDLEHDGDSGINRLRLALGKVGTGLESDTVDTRDRGFVLGQERLYTPIVIRLAHGQFTPLLPFGLLKHHGHSSCRLAAAGIEDMNRDRASLRFRSTANRWGEHGTHVQEKKEEAVLHRNLRAEMSGFVVECQRWRPILVGRGGVFHSRRKPGRKRYCCFGGHGHP